jgi:glyoxylase-like metal-dependent hydrolase (beta-lactamase superfamily II)
MAVKMKVLIIALGIGVLTTPAVPAHAAQQQTDGAGNGRLEQIIPGHFVYSNGARLSGVIVTSEGVVVIDSLSNEAMARNERSLIAAAASQPIKYLISSTFHGNYAYGNVAYPETVKIGTELYKTDLLDTMKEDNMPAAQQAAMLPHQTFRDQMSIFLGGKEIRVMSVGRAHTRGDAIVFVPSDRIVYMSEVFFDGRFPFMNSGYLNWINAIDIALKLDADIFVPGQGPSDIAKNPKASREGLVKARQVLVDFRDAVQKEIARGATEDQTAAAVLLPQYKEMVGYDQQRALLVRRFYRDLKTGLPF